MVLQGHWFSPEAPPEAPHLCQTHLEDVIGTLAAEVVLTWKNDHWLGKRLQTDGTDELLLQAVHEDTERLAYRGRQRRTASWTPAEDSLQTSVFRPMDVSCYRDNIPLYVRGRVEA